MRCFILFAASAHIALPVSLLRYVFHGAGSGVGRNDCRTVPSPSGRGLGVRKASPCGALYYSWLQRTLRSRLIFCIMSLIAQGAYSRRRPLYPGLRPATSPRRGAFDLSLQASRRAEAASVQNTALSPHPCGLPRPSGNVLAMLRPPAPAVSAAPCPAAIHILGLDPVGRVSVAPPGKITAQQGCLEDNQCLPGGAALARTWG